MKRIKYILLILIIQFSFGLNLTLHDYDNPSASHILDTHVMGDILIVVGMVGGIEIYDISNPAELNHLANFNLPNNGGGGGSKPNCVSTYNNYAYITAKNGVGIVNLENPSNPQFVGYIPNTNNMILENLDIYENILAVCAHTDGVLFFNLTNPENPNLINTHETDNAWAVKLYRIFENPNLPILAIIGDETTLSLISVDQSQIIVYSELELEDSIKDIEIINYNTIIIDGIFEVDVVFVALGSGGVNVYDLYPNDLYFLGNINTSGMANRLDGFSSYVAVSDWDDVEVIHVWDHYSGTIVKKGFKNTTRRTMAIATKDNFIYSAEWNSVQVMEYGEIAGADIDLNTYELNYPYVEVGDSYTMPLVITNNGNSELEFGNVFTTNPEFTINEFTSLMPGESQTIEVTYTATENNSSGGLRIWSNDEDESDIVCETNGNIDGANVGEVAPDFELEIVANGEGTYRLSDHLGDIVVLAFFSPT